MKLWQYFVAVFPNKTIAITLLLASTMFGYTSGLQIAAYISRIHLQSAPSDTDDAQSAVYIPTIYLEISDAPRVTEKTVTVDCVGPDKKHLQLTQDACTRFKAAWGAR